MADREEKELSSVPNINRRGLLKCMTWAGTGVVWSLSGGVPRTLGLIGGAALLTAFGILETKIAEPAQQRLERVIVRVAHPLTRSQSAIFAAFARRKR